MLNSHPVVGIVAAVLSILSSGYFGFMLGERIARYRWLAAVWGPLGAIGLACGPILIYETLAEPYTAIAALLAWLVCVGLASGIAVTEARSCRFATLTRRMVGLSYYVGFGAVLAAAVDLVLKAQPSVTLETFTKQSPAFLVCCGVYIFTGIGLCVLHTWSCHRLRKVLRDAGVAGKRQSAMTTQLKDARPQATPAPADHTQSRTDSSDGCSLRNL